MTMDEPYKWSDSTVAKILANKAYMGHTNSHTKTTVSYQNKTVIHIPEEQQILMEDTHEPLVTKEAWNIAKEKNYHKHRTPKRSNEQSKYAGLLHRLQEAHDFLSC